MGLKRINVCKAELIGGEVRLVRKHLSQPRAPALTQCCLLTTDKSPPLSLRCFFYHLLFCFYWLNSSQTVKNSPVIQETQVWSQGQEDPLEKGMVTHSAFFPVEFHGQRSLVGYSPQGSQRVRHDWVTWHWHIFLWLSWVLDAACGI